MNRTSAEPSPLRYRTSPKCRSGRDPPDGDRGSRLSACAQLLGRLTGGFLPLTVEPVGAMKNQLDSCTRRHETRARIESLFACRGPFGVNWCKTSVREPRRISRIHSGSAPPGYHLETAGPTTAVHSPTHVRPASPSDTVDTFRFEYLF